MKVTFGPAKRDATLAQRGIDLADAALVFAGRTASQRDNRKDYGEDRFITAGWLKGRLIAMVWTPRGDERRIISMRYMHAKEEDHWKRLIGP